MDFIKVNIDGFIAQIEINNPEQRNALSSLVLAEFIIAINEVMDSNARVLIIKSSEYSKVWSAGFNIEELPEPGTDPVPYDHPLEVLIREIEKLSIPIIAQLEGSVWGGACDLSFSCDILIGCEKTSFALTPAKIGVPYNSLGIKRILNRVSPNIAKELFFTASPINASRAYNIGIINHLVTSEEIEEFTLNIALKIVENSPLSISVIKKQIDSFSKARPIDDETVAMIDKLRQKAYNSEDYLEGKRAFLEKRKPIFKGL